MKLKKLVFLGCAILLLGSSLLGWLLWQDWTSLDQIADWPKCVFGVSEANQAGQWAQMPYNDPEKYNQLLQELQAKSQPDRAKEQAKRLQADLEALAACPPEDPLLARALYGEAWKTAVERCHAQKTLRRSLMATSLILTGVGAIICCLCALVKLTRLISPCISAVLRSQPNVDEPDIHACDTPVRTTSEDTPDPVDKPARRRPKLTAAEAETAGLAQDPVELPGLRLLRNRADQDSPGYKRHDPAFHAYGLNDLAEVDLRLCNLFSDEPLARPGTNGLKIGPAEHLSDQVGPVTVDVAGAQATSDTGLEQTLQSKTDEVEQQIHDIEEMAQGVQGSADAQSKTVNHALQEMSAQISAIREYAAAQQDRVEKLQTGYDWNIIRQFGLRIIRCVDNLEQRISRQADSEAPPLSEIRDELLFALESSGIEQFTPEIHSSYRGQERSTEAIKEKEPCTDETLTGKIAHIVKPGYQYVIDEENVKIVRTARVKLYG